MSKIDRLDFSNLPPGYSKCLHRTGWSLYHDGRELGFYQARSAIDDLTKAAWSHYKAHHDPPGMWSGYCAVLPLCDQFRPRMGVSIPGIAHLELCVNAERPGTCEEAKAMGRAAAWDHYVDAVKIADHLDGKSGPAETWPERCAWPRPLRWTAEQRNEARRWVADGGVVAGWAPEVLRAH